MPLIPVFGEPEILAEDFVLFCVLEDDWKDFGSESYIHGSQFDFLDNMSGVVLGFVEVDWEGRMTGRSWRGMINYSMDGDHVLRFARGYEVIPSRYKGGF